MSYSQVCEVCSKITILGTKQRVHTILLDTPREHGEEEEEEEAAQPIKQDDSSAAAKVRYITKRSCLYLRHETEQSLLCRYWIYYSFRPFRVNVLT